MTHDQLFFYLHFKYVAIYIYKDLRLYMQNMESASPFQLQLWDIRWVSDILFPISRGPFY